MRFLIWLAPILVMALGILSGRLKTSAASLLGLCIAIPIGLFAGPIDYNLNQVGASLLRGAWIGATITPYILGGLLFWKVAAPAVVERQHARVDRGVIFQACFLVGPFAEAATGFGVGMLATVAMLRHAKLPTVQLMVLALLSQTLIPWGAMGSGTLLAAVYANVSGEALGVFSSLLTSVMMIVIWLPLYWLQIAKAGILGSRRAMISEFCWVIASLGLLTVATWCLGPEIALLASFGPLIVLYTIVRERPSGHRARQLARAALPYALIVSALAIVRLIPALKVAASTVVVFKPYDDLPSWSPAFHAGTWLLIGALICVFIRGTSDCLRDEALAAWNTGKQAVLAVFIFSMLSEVMSKSGISGACAAGLFAAMGNKSLMLTPAISALFGILANTGNASNSLFMPAQVTLATQAGLSIYGVAALQHVSATSMGLFSPVRMSIAAALTNGYGHERSAFKILVPYALWALSLLTLFAFSIPYWK
ncbi:L-lactate permease [Pseudomonas caricapapayae]|uniref:L-lactate permease n=1 Tax=Pseudomonas caricapapayae TaxID=46678 RepID=UPI000F009D12|nr:L-lactate permease [Pseudomonas caricapapayae]